MNVMKFQVRHLMPKIQSQIVSSVNETVPSTVIEKCILITNPRFVSLINNVIEIVKIKSFQVFFFI